MTNEQFKAYLNRKANAFRDEIRKAKEKGEAVTTMEDALSQLETALRIMNYSSGPAARRFKRDYLRRLAGRGITPEI